MELSKQSIEAAMRLSGYEQWRPAVDVPHLNRPRQRPADLPGEGPQAAVMVLLFPGDSHLHPDLNVVLTRRHEDLNKHAGQISFPGGRQDRGESLLTTALRETTEEIGVSAEGIEILGQLNPVYIPPSDFTVLPFVGWHDPRPSFAPSDAEVAEIIEVPVGLLLQPETLVQGKVVTADGKRLEVPFYQVGHHQVWGATAIILGEFIERLARVE